MDGAEFVFPNATNVDISTIVVVEILTCISKYQLNYRAPRRQVQPQEINFQLHPAGMSINQMITFKTLQFIMSEQDNCGNDKKFQDQTVQENGASPFASANAPNVSSSRGIVQAQALRLWLSSDG